MPGDVLQVSGPLLTPASHADLLAAGARAILTTLAGGQPRSRLVNVFGHEGRVRFPAPGVAVRHEIGADPRISILVVDPDDTSRFMQIRGDAVAVGGDLFELRARRITLDAIHR